jgi:hypothetical protein
MQSRKAYLAFAFVAAASLLSAPPAAATGGGKCSPWTVKTDLESPGGDCPGCVGIMRYSVSWTGKTGAPDHVAVLVGGTDTTAVQLIPGMQVYPAGQGDPVTGLGQGVSDAIAVRVNPLPLIKQFSLVVRGGVPAPTWMSLRKGTTKTTCQVPGLKIGADQELACVPNCGNLHPKQPRKVSELVCFEGCCLNTVFDPDTGAVDDDATDLTQESKDAGCELHKKSVKDVEFIVEGVPMQGQFGSGYLSSGPDSCTTYFYGGRLYSFGNPCPQ